METCIAYMLGGNRPCTAGMSYGRDMSSLELEGPDGGDYFRSSKAKTSWGAAIDQDLPGRRDTTLSFLAASSGTLLVPEGLTFCEVLEIAVPMGHCLESVFSLFTGLLFVPVECRTYVIPLGRAGGRMFL